MTSLDDDVEAVAQWGVTTTTSSILSCNGIGSQLPPECAGLGAVRAAMQFIPASPPQERLRITV